MQDQLFQLHLSVATPGTRGIVVELEISDSLNHSFCETATAGGASPWHIRKLTEAGQKLSGGADTYSLCGREVAWDIDVRLTVHHISHCCERCRKAFLAVAQPEVL